MGIDVLGHQIAQEVLRRVAQGESLGSPSLYNIIREVVIDKLLDFDIDWGDNAF